MKFSFYVGFFGNIFGQRIMPLDIVGKNEVRSSTCICSNAWFGNSHVGENDGWVEETKLRYSHKLSRTRFRVQNVSVKFGRTMASYPPSPFLKLPTKVFVPTRMLESQRKDLSDWANKLRSGLGKIDDTRTKVEGSYFQCCLVASSEVQHFSMQNHLFTFMKIIKVK